MLQLYISENVFRSHKDVNNIGSNLHAFDVRYEKNSETAQLIEVEFELSANVDAGIYGYALVLTNKIVSISSDVPRHFFKVKCFITSFFFLMLTLSFSVELRYNALVNCQYDVWE